MRRFSIPSSARKHPRIILRPTALLPPAVLLLTDRSPLALLPFAAAACHELGHLFAMTALGVPVQEIDITPLGAEIRTASHPANPRHAAVIHLAGPAANLLGAAMLFFPERTAAAELFAASSLALGVFNLLPIQNLDGGHLLEVMLSRRAPLTAERITAAASAAALGILWLAAGYLLLLCGGNLSLFIICVFLFAELYLK